MPNHEPRGCSRGASYSWYLYSASRIKYPLIRGRLVKAWREARKTLAPVEAWAAIVGDPETAKSYKSVRGRGGFVRATWEEACEIIAAANVHTIKTWGPDRVVGFSPIPAMSMVSYASGARYLSLIGGTLLSFYDWYCDLPPSSPQTWGEQTDVPESADWYNSAYIIAWGSNVPQTRTPDAHFFVEARYNGTKVVAITPDYAEVAKLSDLWLHPKQGTDAALAMAMGHVILREFFLDRQVPYFQDYCRRYTDMPMLVRLRRDGDRWVAGPLSPPERSAKRAEVGSRSMEDRRCRRRQRRTRRSAGRHRLPLAPRRRTGRAMESRSQGWRNRRGHASGAEPDRSARRRRSRRFPLLRRQAARAFPGERPGRRCADAQRPSAQDRGRRRRSRGGDRL